MLKTNSFINNKIITTALVDQEYFLLEKENADLAGASSPICFESMAVDEHWEYCTDI